MSHLGAVGTRVGRALPPVANNLTGKSARPTRGHAMLFGEFRNGAWTTLERVRLDAPRSTLEIDPDRATCRILVCSPTAESRWTAYLTNVLLRPEQAVAY